MKERDEFGEVVDTLRIRYLEMFMNGAVQELFCFP